MDDNIIKKDSPSALWCLQMAHQTKSHPMECGRLFVTDNFYTRHALGKQLLRLTDGEARLLGTVRMNVVDAVNRPAIKKGIECLQRSERGSWLLVHTLDKPTGRGEEVTRAEKTGYILFKDKKVVVFYTNDLAETPRQDVEGSSEFTLKCVHGLAPLQRWIGNEAMTRTTLQVLCSIVAYNLFMN